MRLKEHVVSNSLYARNFYRITFRSTVKVKTIKIISKGNQMKFRVEMQQMEMELKWNKK